MLRSWLLLCTVALTATLALPPSRPPAARPPAARIGLPRARAAARHVLSVSEVECLVHVVPVEAGYELLCVPDSNRGLFYDISAAVSAELREALEQAHPDTVVRVRTAGALVPMQAVPADTEVSFVRAGGARRADVHFGVRRVLAVRIIGDDVSLSWTAAQISDALFSTNGREVSLKTNMEGCSKGMLQLLPQNGTQIVDGVLDLPVGMNIVGATLANVIDRAKVLMGSLLAVPVTSFQHVIWALPFGTIKGGTASWDAFSVVNGREITLRGDQTTRISFLMHEFGHNLGFRHSGRRLSDGSLSEYGDRTCNMGASATGQQTPKMCFGSSKTFKTGWFAECHEIVTDWALPRRRALVGVSNYGPGSCVAAEQAVVLVVKTGFTDDLFVSYNTATGWNSGVVDGANRVSIVRDRSTTDKTSERQVMLTVGEKFSYTTAKGPVVLKFCEVVSGNAVVATGPAEAVDVCVPHVAVDECAGGSHNCAASATCTDTMYGFACACNAGFDGDGTACTPLPPVDECATGTHGCDVGAACTDTATGYTCSCNAGLVGDGATCAALVDECATGAHDCSATGSTCTDLPIGFDCACSPGFAGDGHTCEDVNECTAGSGNACVQETSVCLNAVGGYLCKCNPGYAGPACVDVNECALATHDCGARSECSNTPGSFTCACSIGFAGEGGRDCTDIDECAAGGHNCAAGAACTNTPGAFTCACAAGFTGDGRATGTGCTDVNECADGTDTCVADAACANMLGGFACTCAPGFVGDGKLCADVGACSASGHGCTDVDECAAGSHNCAVGATCTNTPGAFACACAAGFTGDGRATGTGCTDVDECADGTDGCAATATCTNTPGGVLCMCKAGFIGNGLTCTDRDECADSTHNCNTMHATCTNTPGAFACACKPGFVGDGAVCADVDECMLGLHSCDAVHAVCTNTPGSFACACKPGFSGDGLTCTDNNECADGTHDCSSVGAVCINTPGAFACACAPGFSGDGRSSCTNIDECAAGIDACADTAVCTDTSGSYACTCPPGRVGPACSDVNECSSGTHACPAQATCSNTDGSFTCACNAPAFADASSNQTFSCRSTAASGPSCVAWVSYETWKRSPTLALAVAETDFKWGNKQITQVLINDVSIGVVPDTLTKQDQCALYTHVGTVPLPTDTPEAAPGVRRAKVEVRASAQVNKRAACVYSLDARLIVRHQSGLECVAVVA